MYTLGIDIGGTFTDFALVDESTGTVQVEKEATTALTIESALTAAGFLVIVYSLYETRGL